MKKIEKSWKKNLFEQLNADLLFKSKIFDIIFIIKKMIF